MEIPNYSDIKYFNYDKENIAYRYFNKEPGKKTILIFYGFCGNINMLEFLANHLKDHFSILAIDYPGHGYSKSGEFSIGSFVAICNKLVEFLKEDELILLGYSFGGIIALNFYVENTRKIDKMIFLNSTSCFCPDFITKGFFKFFGFLIRINFRFIIKYLAIPILCDRYMTRDLVKIGRIVAMMNNKKNVIRYYDTIVFGDFSRLLSKIECPVFVIGSSIDMLVPEKNVLKFAAKIKKSVVHIMKDVGHLSIVSKPDRISRLITEFILK